MVQLDVFVSCANLIESGSRSREISQMMVRDARTMGAAGRETNRRKRAVLPPKLNRFPGYLSYSIPSSSFVYNNLKCVKLRTD
jgi:hypothetical protein